MNTEMKNLIPSYNANIGEEFDKASMELKKLSEKYTKLYISFLFMGAFLADLTGTINPKISVPLAILCGLFSLFFYTRKRNRNLVEQWTYTRVIAETIKSEWFKFVVGAGDYPIKDSTDQQYDNDKFNRNVKDFIDKYEQQIHSLGGQYVKPVNVEITEESLEIRKKNLDTRVKYYEANRMQDQMDWYEKKSSIMSKKHTSSTRWFRIFIILSTAIGLMMTISFNDIIKIAFIENNDFFSIFLALAFALDTFTNIEQFERLSIAYKKSYGELKEAIKKLNDPKNDVFRTEKVFSDFVEDIENYISNEHKSWSLTTNTKDMH